MAGPMLCDFGCGLPADFIVGNTETGEQTAACAVDFCRFALEIVKVALPPEEIAAAIGPLFVQGTRPGSEEERPRRARKSKAQATAAADAESPPAPEVAPDAAGADNG